MKWIASIIHPKPLDFEIKEETLHSITGHPDTIEYSLRVYEDNREIYDRYQETLEMVKEEALERFHVPLDAWKQVD